MPLEIRRLRPEDDRSTFRSGNIELDRFFQRFAGQNQFRHHIGTTYVAIEGELIHGFVTVVAAEVEIANLPARRRKGLPGYPLPALRIARLAVHGPSQRRGIGSELLKAAFLLAREMAQKVGCLGVVVDAKADAIAFYESYGFEHMEALAGELGDRPAPSAMFLPLGSIMFDSGVD
ncbi:MAG: GNAT family N-acetyltransferase [Myxococcota bacterium]